MVLVITIMMLAVITAMVTEFAYGVYTTTSALNNWRESQRLSYIAKSGVTLAVKNISDFQSLYTYTYPGSIEMPVAGIVEGFEGSAIVKISDENARFNLNSVVNPNNTTNTTAMDSLKRLLSVLNIKEDLASKIADWIDSDNIPRSGRSEEGAKNSYMQSADELLLVKDMDRQSYEKLQPFVTVHGIDRTEDMRVNINTAPAEVIMSLDGNITRELAERVARYRELEPFKRTSGLLAVAGFEGALGQSLMNRIVVKASNFRIISETEDRRIKRVIESMVEIRGSSSVVRHWREF